MVRKWRFQNTRKRSRQLFPEK